MSANGIAQLPTKEARQKAKLDLAAQNRSADGNPRATYDITQLPTQYDDNSIIDNANTGGLVVGRPWIAISYSVAPRAGSINEGAGLVFDVTTAGVADSTTLYWTVNNGTSNNADFSATSGSFTVTSNAGSFTVTPTADNTTEGSQTFTVQVRTTSTSGTVVATSSSVTINDTSLTPAGLPVNWYGVNYSFVPTGSYSVAGTGVNLPSGSYVNLARNLQGTTFTVTVDANLDTAGAPWVVLWGNERYSFNDGYIMYWVGTTSAQLGILQTRTLTSVTPSITSMGRRVYTSVVDGLNVAFYINGILINSGTLTGSPTTIPNNYFYVGARHANSGAMGSVNDAKGGIYYSVKVQGSALDATAVLNEYNAIAATW